MITRYAILILNSALFVACQTGRPGYKEEGTKLTFFESLDQKPTKAGKNSALAEKMASATQSIEKKLKESPDNAKFRNDLARLYLSQGKLKEADTLVKQSLKSNVHDQDAMLTMAHITYARFQDDLTVYILNNLQPATAESAEALNLQALVAVRKQEDQRAIALLEKAILQKKEDLTAAHVNLGLLKLKYMNFSEARRNFENALKHSPDNLDGKFHLAICLAATGDFVNARKYYGEINSFSDQFPDIKFNYAVLQYRQHEYDHAVSTLNGYIENLKSGKTDNSALALLRELRQQLAIASVEGKKSSEDKIRKLNASSKDDFALDEGYIFTNTGPMSGH